MPCSGSMRAMVAICSCGATEWCQALPRAGWETAVGTRGGAGLINWRGGFLGTSEKVVW